MHAGRWVACSVGTLLVLGTVGACRSSAPKKSAPSPSVTTIVVTASTPKPSSTKPSPSPSHKLARKLPGTCDSLLPSLDVENALGVSVPGRTAFVVGVAEKNIGRLAYLNCRYGLPASRAAAAKAQPRVEIGVSLYDTPGQAQRRVVGTISDYRDHGATLQPATVSGIKGTLLVGGSSPGYNVPLLVVVSGQRTVAVSVVASLLPSAKRGPAMSRLAALALERTAA